MPGALMYIHSRVKSMDTLATYRQAAQERARRVESAQRQRRERAWQVARAAADLLRSRYGATRVVVFGSLTRAEGFHPWSDVDLGAWGVAPEDYFEAVARVLDVGGDIEVDLVQAERCKPSLRDALQHGVEV